MRYRLDEIVDVTIGQSPKSKYYNTHPTRTRSTVLNSRQPQEEKNGLFSDSDILVLQTIYRPDLKTGGSW